MNLTDRQHALVKLLTTPNEGFAMHWIALEEPHLGVTAALQQAERNHPGLLYVPCERETQAARLLSLRTETKGLDTGVRLWRVLDVLKSRCERVRRACVPTLVFEDCQGLEPARLDRLSNLLAFAAYQQKIPLRAVLIFAASYVYDRAQKCQVPVFRGAFHRAEGPTFPAFRRQRIRAHAWSLGLKGLKHLMAPKPFDAAAEEAPLLKAVS
ncbi:MAG: hypothetical protein M5U26_08245 [Planctomycetota bacterium]|nr:hypothetical protein [Planctomycetota bacterium]